MSTWYSVDLGDGKAAFGPSKHILDLFTPAFVAAGAPLDMAVFTRNDKNVITVYFSPSAQGLAQLFKATPCDQPSSTDLAMLAGDTRAWKIFFPNVTF